MELVTVFYDFWHVIFFFFWLIIKFLPLCPFCRVNKTATMLKLNGHWQHHFEAAGFVTGGKSLVLTLYSSTPQL